MQARNNVHRAAMLLGAAVVGKVGRLGNKLKEHHAKMREEGAALFLSQPTAIRLHSVSHCLQYAPCLLQSDCILLLLPETGPIFGPRVTV